MKRFLQLGLIQVPCYLVFGAMAWWFHSRFGSNVWPSIFFSGWCAARLSATLEHDFGLYHERREG